MVKRAIILLFLNEVLGRVVKIESHLNMMKSACAGCSTFDMFVKPISDELDKEVLTLENLIKVFDVEKLV